MPRIQTLALVFALVAMLGLGSSPAFAQTESATAEDGAPASEAPGPAATVPDVPLGANLTPPVGIAPPVITPGGVGQSGSASVSHTPGTLTSGGGRNRTTTETVPENTSVSAPSSQTEADAPVQTCADFPTWYDAQLALESSIDPPQQRELDPDGDTIACEEYMYPGG